MLKRIFDIFFSFLGLILLSPFFLLIALIIKMSSKGPVFFVQERVGKNAKIFSMYKFRTMKENSEKDGPLTIGNRDPRITGIGYLLRKFKIDEFPQLINVLKGEMSFVGPRPEVPRYVKLYTDEQRKVLMVKPGITDNASIEYRNENNLLANSKDPENYYVSEIMPKKIRINMEYINERNFFSDLRIIFKTFVAMFK